MKEWVVIHKIKGLHDDGCGLSIRAISQELGISRNTVRKYLRADEVAIATAQLDRLREKRLDEHRDYIVHLLGAFFGFLYYRSGIRFSGFVPSRSREVGARSRPRL